ncbi:dolichyl-phosphate-mannose--protein mannosyltransferase [Malassezia cuniculi]|uniref:Dolichyl-phosphate-mannose--protein mannosyltransferase n=1 Tax=Malassezia cuniculi TaxID=948313 RepID=A0AAF0ERG6_9BASI|nr:dolichyl-phosphate-mannose--protein mannosyltransferase [Malassezia cuniculi]
MAYAGAAGPQMMMRARQVPATETAEPLLSSAEAEKEAANHPRAPARHVAATLSRGDWLVVAFLSLLALVTRFYAISQPSSVVFDEVHFGGFASKYIKQRFFMDVHPPLAKLLITFAAWLGGFKGNFSFDPLGSEYLDESNQERVPYVMMRSVGALLGAAVIPLAYLTMRGLGLRGISALVAASFVALDNALTTQSRLILLDAPLLFFIALSIYAWVVFSQIDAQAPFTRRWWIYLSLTGAGLGASVSCKWVGLFTIAAVGVAVIVQLWERLADLRVPIRTLVAHFMARALCLIVIPVVMYIGFFRIHFAILVNSGTGDQFMTWPFRHTLNGNKIPDRPARVAYGSRVQIMHLNSFGGYLHSHPYSYETGSNQQQITLYPYRDSNNEWYILEAPIGDLAFDRDENDTTIRPDDEVTRYLNQTKFVHDEDNIRLLHVQTDVRLHSHDNHRPPVTEADYQDEVSGYGGFSDFPKFGGDGNDDWRIFIYDQQRLPRKIGRTDVTVLRSILQIYHPTTRCFLFSHPINLPEWGFKQQEVTCNHNPTLPGTLWYIESAEHPLVTKENSPMVNYLLPSFWQKFVELQKTMWTRNKLITEHHVYESRPESWPFLYRGINFWTKHHRQIYLIGNPVVWWSASTSVLVYILARLVLMLRAKRQCTDFNNANLVYYDRTCMFLVFTWAVHYFPFMAMKRQLFLHHYLPSLYFSVLVLATLFDYGTNRLRPRLRAYVGLGVIALAFLYFLRYSPLTYALPWSNSQCGNAILRSSWDFNCIENPLDINEYKKYPPAVYDPQAGHTSRHGILDFVLPHGSTTDVHPNVAHPARPVETQPSASGEQVPAQNAAEKSATPKVQHADELDPQKLREAILKGTSILSKSSTSSSSSSAPGAA